MSATEEILGLIASAVDSTGHGGASALLSVGVVDGRAKSELQSVIENALDHREKKYDNPRNEENRTIEEHIRLIKEENKQDEEKIKKAQKILQEITDPVKSFDITLNKTIKQFGPFGEALGIATNALKMFIDHQFKWLERYRQLNDVGVTLNGSLGSLADRATAAGLRIDEYTELVKSHSTTVAKLGGLYGDGIKTFTTLIKNNKELGYQLGMMPQQVAKISATFASNSELGLNNNETMATLTSKTQEYIIWLDRLTKATGKSREQVLEETKARENDLRLKTLTRNPTNKKKLDILMGMNPNLTTEDQIAFLSGRMTGNLGMMSTAPYVGDILNKLGKSRSQDEIVDMMNSYAPLMKQLGKDMYSEMKGTAGWMPAEFYNNRYGAIEYFNNFNQKGFEQGGTLTAEGETNKNLRLLNEQLNRITNGISKSFLMSPDKMVNVTDMLLKYIPIIAATASAILATIAVKSFWNLRNERLRIGNFSFYNMKDAQNMTRKLGRKIIPEPARRFVGSAWNATKGFAGSAWDNTGGRMVSSLMSGLRRFGGSALGRIIKNAGSFFGKLITKAIPQLLKFGFKMVPIVGWIWTALEAIIFAIKNRNIIAKWTGKIAGMLCRAIVGMFKSLWNVIVSIAKAVGNFLAHPIDTIKKLAKGEGEFFKNMGEGFKEGYYGTKEESSNDEESEEESTSNGSSLDDNLSYDSNDMEYGGSSDYNYSQSRRIYRPNPTLTSLNSNSEKSLTSINMLVEYAKKISEHTAVLKEFDKEFKRTSSEKSSGLGKNFLLALTLGMLGAPLAMIKGGDFIGKLLSGDKDNESSATDKLMESSPKMKREIIREKFHISLANGKYLYNDQDVSSPELDEAIHNEWKDYNSYTGAYSSDELEKKYGKGARHFRHAIYDQNIQALIRNAAQNPQNTLEPLKSLPETETTEKEQESKTDDLLNIMTKMQVTLSDIHNTLTEISNSNSDISRSTKEICWNTFDNGEGVTQ